MKRPYGEAGTFQSVSESQANRVCSGFLGQLGAPMAVKELGGRQGKKPFYQDALKKLPGGALHQVLCLARLPCLPCCG
jgi:hypothetical protein